MNEVKTILETLERKYAPGKGRPMRTSSDVLRRYTRRSRKRKYSSREVEAVRVAVAVRAAVKVLAAE